MPVSAALHPAQKAFAFSLPVPGSEPIEVLLGAANMPSAAGPGDGLDRPIPPELPQSAARQIAVAVAGLPRETGAGVDIALDPPELGRVRLSLVEINGTLTLSIIAERPETVDLMRRHLVLLADEFARQGLDAPMVDISGERQGRQGAQGASPPPSADRMTDAPAPPVPTAPPITRSAKADGLDLRL
jgi:flagellar hook-length control protein FliK